MQTLVLTRVICIASMMPALASKSVPKAAPGIHQGAKFDKTDDVIASEFKEEYSFVQQPSDSSEDPLEGKGQDYDEPWEDEEETESSRRIEKGSILAMLDKLDVSHAFDSFKKGLRDTDFGANIDVDSEAKKEDGPDDGDGEQRPTSEEEPESSKNESSFTESMIYAFLNSSMFNTLKSGLKSSLQQGVKEFVQSPEVKDTTAGGIIGLLGGFLEDTSKPVCSEGQAAVPKRDSHKKLKANGCGPDSLKIDEPHGLFACCNSHDVCFSTCGTNHSWCEEEFRVCAARICEERPDAAKEDCKVTLKTLTLMSTGWGEKFHLTSQKDACDCVKAGDAHASHYAYLRSLLQEYEPDKATDDRVEGLLKTWKGDEGKMYHALVRRHGSNFVQFTKVDPVFAEGSAFSNL